ncbi:MAG: hypothetical protein WCO05_00410 [Candidatus Moraniibacteriota bacterium]
MMKIIFKKTATSALVLLIVATFLPLSEAFAQAGQNGEKPTREEVKTKVNEKSNGNFCTAIEEKGGKFLENWEQKGTSIKSKKDERKNKWTEKMVANDARLAEIRAKAEAEMAKKMADLLSKPGITDAQKTAINTFSATQKTALAKRRAAVDAARKTFQTGVQSAVSTKQSGMDAVVATFKNSISAAFGKAKTDCGAGVEVGAVKETLRASLKTAREKFKSDRESNAKLKVSIEPLIVARKTAFEAARNAYKATMEPARTALKAAFPDGSVDVPAEE